MVVYSGGLDSTVLLHKLAAQSRVAGLGFCTDKGIPKKWSSPRKIAAN